MGRLLFGTDGIRGVAGKYPLDPPTANALGAGLGQLVLERNRNTHQDPDVVIGMDTRESGPWLAAEVAGGLARHGVAARFAGVTTTPGVAYLAKNGPFAAGVMISASHNPFEDNGIKVIGHSGYKLPDEEEEHLEAKLFDHLKQGIGSSPATLTVDEGLDQTYIDHLAATAAKRFGGLRLVVDCANGSASHLAPALLGRLGAEVLELCCVPNGRNINLGCGSLYLDALKTEVLARSADLGIAFDGDADRALFISASGRIVDGDMVMLICAVRLHEQGRLKDRSGRPVVVATVMSNLGLQKALEAHGIHLVRTPVGDKYVLEEMLRLGAVLGGEQSGHVIFHEYATTGDGMLTALRVLDIMTASGNTLDELTAGFELYPQILVNVKVKERRPIEDLPAVCDDIRAVRNSFGDTGRVLVRFSGTEPLARIMVEGPDAERVEMFANRIASHIRSELGAE